MKKAPPSIYADPRWPPLRLKAVKQSGWRCSHCGANVSGKGAARVDHIQLVSVRPDLAFEISNLRVLCVPCDNARHSEKGGGRAANRHVIGEDGWSIE